MNYPQRINKYLAHTGVASRREVDELINNKQITINGKLAQIGQLVHDADTVEIRGKTKPKSYLAYYKGRGIITHSPAPGETDVTSRLATDFGVTNVTPVGRLDKDSEGLLMLSNDGRITSALLNPDAGTEKEYDVQVDKEVKPTFLRAMASGVSIEGYRTKPATATAHPRNKKRFYITLTEGKKHQIRRMCAALGYQIVSLKRIRIANIELGKLKPNQYRKLQGAELQEFLQHLNIK